MKKILVRLCIALVVLLVLAVLVVHFFLDGAVKRGVETIGPKVTKVDVKLDGVHLSLLSGSGSIKGLTLGNPDPYKTPHSISVGTVAIVLKPGSLLADKIIIKSINVESPEIAFEGGLSGNNLSKLLANMNETSSGPNGTNIAGATPKEQEKAGKKLEVDDFLITNAKLTATITDLGSKTVSVTLKEIHLTNLGTGPDGITPAELTKLAVSEIEKQALDAIKGQLGDLGKAAENLTKGLGKNAGGALTNVTQGIGNLFKKK